MSLVVHDNSCCVAGVCCWRIKPSVLLFCAPQVSWGELWSKTKVDMVLKHAASLNLVMDVVVALQNSSRLQFVNSEAVKLALKSQNAMEYQSSLDCMA